MNERLKRNEVDIKATWDLDDLFTSAEEYDIGVKKTLKKVIDIQQYKGNLSNSPQSLLKGIIALENLIIDLYSVGTFAHLKQAVDATNPAVQELSIKFGSMAAQVEADITFYENEISGISEEDLSRFIKEEPGLSTYKPYLDEIMEAKPFKLSDDTEEMLAALGEVTSAPYSTYSMSKATDMEFDSFQDSEGNTLPNSFALFEGNYEYSEDPVIRKNAYASFNKTLNQYKNTYASIYNTEVKKQVTLSRLRGYESVTDMLLQSQKVTKEMYNRQIDVIYNELAPHMRKFASLIKKELNLDTINFYDLKAPIDLTYNPSATYDEVKETIIKSMEIMGDEYIDIIKRAFDERWIDYTDNVGKATGAFCASPYASHSYILVTFQDQMRDAFTIAHELGHACHFTLANSHQKYFNTSPSRYLIEAPSTMNEMLLGRYMLKENDDPKVRKWVILQFLGTYYHNFVTHLLEAAFQRKVYALAEQGQPLSAQLFCNTKLEVLKGFWGDAVEIDGNAGMTWMRQPHYYMGLYPYTYSAGLTASTAVSEMIFEEGQPAVDRWINMLKAGGSLKPLELLKIAGMDFTTDEPVQKAISYVGKLISELEELCK